MYEEAEIVLNFWCGPRTLSTSTTYSFSQRNDTTAIDEPLYASWLHKNPTIFRPYRDELLNSMNSDGNEVLRSLKKMNKGKRIVMAKHITKFIDGLDRSLLYEKGMKHIFLVRDPLDMILSWGANGEVHREGCTLNATSLLQAVSLFAEIRQATGTTPIVVDSDILKAHPKEVLSELCNKLDIPFDENQLSWPAGPKPDVDGLWAKYWYDRTHQATGFESSEMGGQKLYPSLSPQMLEVYREANSLHDLLRRHAIGVDPLNPGSSCYKPTVTAPVGKDTTIVDHGMQMRGTKLGDPRNADILVWIGDRLYPREQAKVSVLDSAVQGGDAVWEGIRVYDGRCFKLEEHINRLFDSARAMLFENVPSREFIYNAVFKTLQVNGMRDGVHMRLTLTRGAKLTSSMNPKFNVFGTNLIILPEWKPVGDAATYDNNAGIMLVTATNRRNPPQCVDSKIHHCNLINNILPKIQANNAGAADALMLDTEGFVSETNATNFFMVKHGVLSTPHADYCLPGITRQTVMKIARDLGIPLEERRVSLAEVHAADEAFTTGSMGELTPVVLVDGRRVGNNSDKVDFPIMARISARYREMTNAEGIPIP